jgi:hypothetical protein
VVRLFGKVFGLPRICSTSAENPGRRRRRSGCRKAAAGSCSSRAERAASRHSRSSTCECSKTLPVFGAGTADLILDVLNVVNDTAEEALVSDLGVRLNLER